MIVKNSSLSVDTEKLRKKILDLAMRGKLVPQDRQDEPASVLLEKIKEDTDRKIKGKITKKIRIEKHSDEEKLTYEVPDSWVWTRLGNIIYKLSDGAHKTPNYVEKGIPFLSVKDISTGEIDFSNTKYVSEEVHESLYSRCNPEKGDILLTKVGTTGVPAIVNTNEIFDLFVSVALLKFNHEFIDKSFLKYLINSPIVQKQADLNTRGVGNKNWVLRDIAGTLIPLPPLAEQKRIVAKVEECMQAIKTIEDSSKEYEKLENQLDKEVLDLAMRGKLVPQDSQDEPASVLLEKIKGERAQLIKEKKIKKSKPLPEITEEEKPFEIPESWEWVRLNEVGVITSGGTPKRNVLEYWNSEDIPWITPATMGKNKDKIFNGKFEYISEEGLAKSSAQLIEKNSIVFSSRAPIGYINIVPFDFTTNQGCKSFTGIGVYIDYVYYAIKHQVPYIEKKGSGTTFKEVSATVFKSSIIPLPPLAEQKRIVAKIEEIKQYLKS